MSPTAAAMAATLHLLAALALLWGTPLKNFEVPERAIDVTMEEPPAPKAETPPSPLPAATPPGAQAGPKPTPAPAPPIQAKPAPSEKNVPLGVRPPSERVAEPPQQAAAQPPPPKQEPQPEPPKQAAAEPPPAKPEPQPEPAKPAETKLPAVEVPAAPLSMQDFVRAAPPPPPQEIVRPQPRVQPTPPQAMPTVQPPPPQQQFAPSPLGHPQQQQQHPPANSQASATLVNPADAAARTRAADEYTWAVIRKFSQYLPDLREKNEGGTVVVRMVIARDGRLLESSVAKSSGVLALDKGMLDALRAAAPYPPLPAEIPGDHIVFTQPVTAAKR
jgi:protein TonB